ncbi:glutathione synthase [Algoriphagus boseongensis]|uniref:Glutathione synthetase n=1 Tax=Algoriphagus boseongensis TaxID=1442587 RepID=A0A4R6TBR1_9BACT|nr:glutathione synthase [Algoriphagus boseongensis]TDQ19482.1 glutathione synthase [Algoriphagus boseongensis]
MTRPKRLAVVMDPMQSINPKKDTSLELMIEAQNRSWEVFYLEMKDLFLKNGDAEGLLRKVKLFKDQQPWFEEVATSYEKLSDIDVILMRKDPPFDIEYIMATYILEKAEESGAWVINKPSSIRDVNEKVFTAWFPQCCPSGLMTRSIAEVRKFLTHHKKIVVKPTHKMGGQSIFILTEGDPNTQVILEEITQRGTVFIVAQAYIPEIKTQGDKRIILIDGEPVPYGIARIPEGDDHRGNLAVGASAKGFPLSERDLWICDQIKPTLKKKGLFFVGIDVIGEFMTEINVTSPTGIKEIDKFHGTHIASLFWEKVEEKLKKRADA